jgi:hypothetical protein
VKSNATDIVMGKFLPYYKVFMDLFMKNPTLPLTPFNVTFPFSFMIINYAPEMDFPLPATKVSSATCSQKSFPRKSLKNDKLNLWTRTPWGQYPGQKRETKFFMLLLTFDNFYCQRLKEDKQNNFSLKMCACNVITWINSQFYLGYPGDTWIRS